MELQEIIFNHFMLDLKLLILWLICISKHIVNNYMAQLWNLISKNI